MTWCERFMILFLSADLKHASNGNRKSSESWLTFTRCTKLVLIFPEVQAFKAVMRSCGCCPFSIGRSWKILEDLWRSWKMDLGARYRDIAVVDRRLVISGGPYSALWKTARDGLLQKSHAESGILGILGIGIMIIEIAPRFQRVIWSGIIGDDNELIIRYLPAPARETSEGRILESSGEMEDSHLGFCIQKLGIGNWPNIQHPSTSINIHTNMHKYHPRSINIHTHMHK